MSNMKILIRFDDICPTMDWEQWKKAKQMIDEAGVTALLGVVPDCTDPDLEIEEPREDFWLYIKELQENGFTIAMHGYHHQFELKANGLITKNKISEFAGLSYEIQLDKIRKGKEILKSHGIETDVFFAPAHSYDDNTLRALSASGFKYVSDGYSYKPYHRYGIKLLPCPTSGIPRVKQNAHYLTAVVHTHEWIRDDKKRDMEKFISLLDRYSKSIVHFNEFCYWESGCALIQRIYEWLSVFVIKRFKTLLFQMKNKISENYQ